MSNTITFDYEYLLVKDGKKLSTRSEAIQKDLGIKDIMNEVIRNRKKDEMSRQDIQDFKERVKRRHNDFFSDDSYALNYSSAFEVLGFNVGCSRWAFERDVDHLINAYALRPLYLKYSKDSNVIAYSHRKRGWELFKWTVDENFKFDVSTNFGFGSSSYFDMTLYWKEIPIINYLHIIFYRYAQYYNLKRVTESYLVNEESWKRCFDNLIYYVNSFYNRGSSNFVDKYFVDTCKQLVDGLEFNLHENLFVGLTSKDIDDLFRTDNCFSKIVLNEKTGSNLSFKVDDTVAKTIMNNILNNTYLKELIEKDTLSMDDANVVLSHLIKDYSSLSNLEKKAKTYVFMLNLLKIVKQNPSNEVLSCLFKWLLKILDTNNRYNNDSFLYLIENSYDLQVKRSDQMKATLNSIKEFKDTEMNYIFIYHKDRLSKLLAELLEQNVALLEELKYQRKITKANITRVSKKKNAEFEILKEKKSYKYNEIYKAYFDLFRNQFYKILVYESGAYTIVEEEYNVLLEQLKKLKSSAENEKFDLNTIMKLDTFKTSLQTISYGNGSYNIYQDEILQSYEKNKGENEKEVLSAISNTFKDIQEIIKNLMNTSCESFDKTNSEAVLDLFKNIRVITNYYTSKQNKKIELTKNEYSYLFEYFCYVYNNAITNSSSEYKKNHSEYDEDAKNYNALVSKLNSLNTELYELNAKIAKIEGFNKEFQEKLI